MIEIEGLGFQRDGASVLHDISARIAPFGITAIIGPNGAGKSTLLHCMAGLLSPSSGVVRLNGADVHGASPSDRARLLSILTQSQPQVPRLSVGDLVAFGRWPHHRGRPGPEDTRIVEEAIARFQLDPLRDTPLDALSGGQRQRAYVAMAWAQSTPYLLLDEPLSALDPRVAKSIMAQLKDMSRNGRGVVIVLHDLQIAAQWADAVIALKDGALFAAGAAEATLTDATLSALYDTPLSVRPQADGRVAVLT